MEIKHTPGPWFPVVGIIGDEECLCIANKENHNDKDNEAPLICEVSKIITSNDTDVSNAFLISAAPELFEACLWAKSLIDALGNSEEIHGKNYLQLCNAINKAEGK